MKCAYILPLLPCYFAVIERIGAGWYFYTFVPFILVCGLLFVLLGIWCVCASIPARLLGVRCSGPVCCHRSRGAGLCPGVVLLLFQCAGGVSWCGCGVYDRAGSTLGGGQQGADSPSISGGAKLRKNMALWEIFSTKFFQKIF